MNRGIYGSGIRSERVSYHPSEFTMRINTLPLEICPCLQNEIALELLPGKMKFILLSPDVGARGGQIILVRSLIVNHLAFLLHLTNILVAVEKAEGLLP